MSPERLAGLLLAAAVATSVGCATTRGTDATTSSPTGTPDCTRSVSGDVETARSRLEAERLDEALLYIRGLDACPDALESAAYLQLAMDVYEEKGWLNEAWAVALLLGQIEESRTDPELAERTAARRERFAAAYALVTVRSDLRRAPRVSYAGPVQDEATKSQVAAFSEGRGVVVDGGRLGFWLFPGRYEVDGEPLALAPGQRVDLP